MSAKVHTFLLIGFAKCAKDLVKYCDTSDDGRVLVTKKWLEKLSYLAQRAQKEIEESRNENDKY